jgi:regulator of sirC expression with transglutaminase-like and TPR domain
VDFNIFGSSLSIPTFVSMVETKEFIALLNLIEDPDDRVFEAVSTRLMSYGTPVIPHLENFWENTIDIVIQERLELIIHRIHFTELYSSLREWGAATSHALLPAAILIARFLYPNLDTEKFITDIDRLKRTIWLELNNYLTPLEQGTVLKNILYQYFGLKGNSNNPQLPNEYLVPNILESKKGNQTGIGILYLILTEWLDIPIHYILVPHQFILAYFSTTNDKDSKQNIPFFIEPASGQIFAKNELERYFQKISINLTSEFLEPQDNPTVIRKLLTDFKECFTADNQLHYADEINSLIELLD